MKLSSQSSRRCFLGTSFAGGVSLLSGARVSGKESQGSLAFPRVSPESEGLAGKHIVDFIDAMAKEGHEIHGLMILRNGNVIAEGWAHPYGPEINHSMYSLSKSFTSTAVGLAVGEGLFQITDKVVSFFPEEAPDEISENLASMEIRDLLTMSAGMAKSASSSVFNTKNWVEAFLREPVLEIPGTTFDYNTAATYMLSAIIQKVTGEKLIDFLSPRLFEKTGIFGATWDECPLGINKGGFGLNINTEGLARFGQLYLQKGRWNGEEVVSEAWINEATGKQIQQEADDNGNPDWQQGYGYQFWRSRHNAYRGDGAFGQFTIVIPEKRAVIVMSSESASMQGELDLVWKHLLSHFQEEALSPAKAGERMMKEQLDEMAVPYLRGGRVSKQSVLVSGRVIQFPANPMKLDTLMLEFNANETKVSGGSEEKGDWEASVGFREWKRGLMPIAVSNSWLVSRGKTDEKGFSKVALSGSWKDGHTFEMVWRYYETPHHDLVRIRFEEEGATLELFDSLSFRKGKGAKPKVKLSGVFVERPAE